MPRRRLVAMRRALAGAALAMAAAGCAPGMHAQSPTPARGDPGLARLEAQLAELAKIAGGEVGVAAVHLESGRAVNDVGIVDLPGGAGHVVTVVFVKNAEDAAAGERAIAQIARAAYDYFAMVPAPGGTADGRGAAR